MSVLTSKAESAAMLFPVTRTSSEGSNFMNLGLSTVKYIESSTSEAAFTESFMSEPRIVTSDANFN